MDNNTRKKLVEFINDRKQFDADKNLFTLRFASADKNYFQEKESDTFVVCRHHSNSSKIIRNVNIDDVVSVIERLLNSIKGSNISALEINVQTNLDPDEIEYEKVAELYDGKHLFTDNLCNYRYVDSDSTIAGLLSFAYKKMQIRELYYSAYSSAFDTQGFNVGHYYEIQYTVDDRKKELMEAIQWLQEGAEFLGYDFVLSTIYSNDDLKKYPKKQWDLLSKLVSIHGFIER